MVRGSPGPMLESLLSFPLGYSESFLNYLFYLLLLLPLCWSNCCVVPFAMADAPPRFFVDPGGCRRERVAPKRPAPRDLRPVVHSAYEDENKQGLGYNEHDPRHGLRLGRVLVGGVVNTSRSERIQARYDGGVRRPRVSVGQYQIVERVAPWLWASRTDTLRMCSWSVGEFVSSDETRDSNARPLK